MISPFYINLLLGLLIELVYFGLELVYTGIVELLYPDTELQLELAYSDIVFMNSNTPVDQDDQNKNPFKIPAIPKRKASELDKMPEVPQQEAEQDKYLEDETGESLNDLNRTLKQVRRARMLDRRLPEDQKHSNHHLSDITEEFSSYFDEESGNNITEGLRQVEDMLREEASIYRKEKLAQEQLEQQQLQQQQQEQQRYNQFSEQNNPPLKKKKGEDLLEDIPVEMPSFMDDWD